ncbi:hypothetical protein [Aestuariirhabdus sp. LZHN29]|uniref:hypothetical protein n=1 Tax=Aestuariirhabdus sp. LZHN29 TaxID=3417462 RepID=UPI003CEA63DE
MQKSPDAVALDASASHNDSMSLRILIIACTLLIGGCATTAPLPQTTPGVAADAPQPSAKVAELGWRRILLQHQWDKEKTPDWSMDLLLAGELLGPGIDRYRDQLRYWRFHRRAGNDSTGHQLSLLLYTDQATASAIYQQVLDHPWTPELLATDLKRISHRGINHNSEPAIADRSDPNWSPEMMRAWPAYITGVSELWLALIRDYRSQQPLPSALAAARKRYAAIDKRLTDTWQEEGQHALLHHLSALFGYRPLLIRY